MYDDEDYRRPKHMRAIEQRGKTLRVVTREAELQEGSPDQPRDDHGRFATSGGGAVAAAKITIRTGKGATFSTHGQAQPKTGYMVAEAAHEHIATVRSEDDIHDAIVAYAKNNETTLLRRDVFLGTWLEKDQLFLDNSHNIQDRATAFQFSHANNQYAVYNVNTGKVENTMQDGNRPNETKAPITEADAPEEKPVHKMFFDPKMDAREIAHTIWENRDKSAFD